MRLIDIPQAVLMPSTGRKTVPNLSLDDVEALAHNGFAHTAIDAGWDAFTAAARATGIAAMSIHNSYNCGVLGHHAERLAEDGLLGLCWHKPVFDCRA